MRTERIDTPENQEFRYRLAMECARESGERIIDMMLEETFKRRQRQVSENGNKSLPGYEAETTEV